MLAGRYLFLITQPLHEKDDFFSGLEFILFKLIAFIMIV